MNLEKSRKRQFSVNLQTNHIQTLIGLQFSENVFHWSKYKPRDKFFSWTFDILLINSSRYLFFEVYFSPHHRNIVSGYRPDSKRNQSSNKNKHFHLFLSWNKKKNIFTCFFNIKLKFLVNKFYFSSVSSYDFMKTFSETAVHRCSSK